MSTKAGLAALMCAAAFADCSGSDGRLPLIARGDAVRIIATGGSACPATFAQSDFDDSSWQKVTLPMASVPAGGVCMRAAFDATQATTNIVGSQSLCRLRTRRCLNAGKPLGADVKNGGGLDWSTDDDDFPRCRRTAGRAEPLLHARSQAVPVAVQAKHNVLALQIPETPAAGRHSAVLSATTVSADTSYR